MTSPSKPTTSPRFEPGAKVRVKSGVTVPDFEDIPLGGWTGTIRGVEQTDDQVTYEITWDERTLAGMHPVYRKRCRRDDCDVETMWLGDDDLEADDGTPVPIEQPAEILTPPLSQKDQDDRVRMALGLTHDDPLPEISLETLLTYHRYLSGHLKFPFNALCGDEEIGPFSRKRATVIVTGLLDPAEHILIEEDGLICTGRDRDEAIEFPLCEIEVKKKDPNFKLVSDYAYWFQNWPCRHESHTDREDFDQEVESESPPTSQWGFLKAVVVCGIAGGLLGATIGAALRALDGARPAALIGGLPLAVIGAFALGRYWSLEPGRWHRRGARGTESGRTGTTTAGIVPGYDRGDLRRHPLPGVRARPGTGPRRGVLRCSHRDGRRVRAVADTDRVIAPVAEDVLGIRRAG